LEKTRANPGKNIFQSLDFIIGIKDKMAAMVTCKRKGYPLIRAPWKGRR